jgi:hypothetical protein
MILNDVIDMLFPLQSCLAGGSMQQSTNLAVCFTERPTEIVVVSSHQPGVMAASNR